MWINPDHVVSCEYAQDGVNTIMTLVDGAQSRKVLLQGKADALVPLLIHGWVSVR